MVQWIFANDQRSSKNPDLQNIEFKKKKKPKKQILNSHETNILRWTISWSRKCLRNNRKRMKTFFPILLAISTLFNCSFHAKKKASNLPTIMIRLWFVFIKAQRMNCSTWTNRAIVGPHCRPPFANRFEETGAEKKIGFES